MLQEWMGHKHISTTQCYADYAPSSYEAELVAGAFARSDGTGWQSGGNLSESEGTERTSSPVNTGDSPEHTP